MYVKFDFKKLDARTRVLMVGEVTRASREDQLYFSRRFTSVGREKWPEWLLAAAREYDEHWLAYQVETLGAIEDMEVRTKPTGGYSLAHVPHTAAQTLADGQFNRFYMAAICCRAIEDGRTDVVVYRGRARDTHRPESITLDGTRQSAPQLLQSLRSRDLSLKCDLLKPNSGLTIDY